MLQGERFHEARCYHGKTPLVELTFNVTVWRAMVVEEDRKEILSQQRIAWAAKAPSPAELLRQLQEYVRSRDSRQQQQPGSPASPGSGLDVEMLGRSSAAVVDPNHPAEVILRDIAAQPGDTAADKFNAYIWQRGASFFTRPPAEDYINPDEENVCPIEPSQPPTTLTRNVLREHRSQQRQSLNMFLSWATGAAVLANPGAAGAASSTSLIGLEWRGTERILCTLTQVSDTAFHAKPSLHEEHTLFVDGRYIFTYIIDAVETSLGGGLAARLQDDARTTSSSNAGVRASMDANQLEAHERERRSLLKQALAAKHGKYGTPLEGGATLGLTSPPLSATAAAGTSFRKQSRKDATATGFAPAPAVLNVARIHVMGTLEHSSGVDRDSLFLRANWMLPEGCDDDAQLNERCGMKPQREVTSQMAFAARIVNKQYAWDTVHTFNLPFEYHCTLPAKQTTPLRLVVSLFTMGSGADDHQAVQGYGVLSVSATPGVYVEDVLLWRPRPTGREFLKALFVGGGPSLADLADVGIPAHVRGVVVKSGLQTESAGSLRVRYMVVAQCAPEPEKKELIPPLVPRSSTLRRQSAVQLKSE